ncbi:hypothetical protein FS842_003237 [Serendipita sp. 407]|nr:hypothetical protein FS842_003237 [Serendipita sp. 407]
MVCREFAYQPPVKDDRQTPRPLQSMSNPRHEIAPQNIPSTSKQPQFHPPSRPGTHFNAQGNLVNNQVDRISNFSAGPNLKLGMQQRSSRNPPGTPLPNLTATRSATNHASLLPHQRTPVVPNAPQAVGGSRRFVPPTPRQPGVLQPLLHAGSLQRSVASTPRFPNSMPPPPLPSFNNGSRFRAGNFG